MFRSSEPFLESLESRVAPATLATVVSVGSTGNETIQSIKVDGSGNSYVVGTFQGTVDFDPSASVVNLTAPAGKYDLFVAKYTSTGQLAWVDQIEDTQENFNPGQNNSFIPVLTVTPAGDVYIAGTYNAGLSSPATVNFYNAGNTSFPAVSVTGLGSDFTPSDVYVAKIDSNGYFQWAESFGDTSAGSGLGAIAADDSGNVYIVGKFQSGPSMGSLTFATSPSPTTLSVNSYTENLFIAKLDSGGAPIWAQQTNSSAGTSSNFTSIVDDSSSLAVDSSGDVYVGGTFSGSLSLGSGSLLSLGADFQDGYVAKLDSSGNWVWTHQVNTGPNGGLDRIAVDEAGHVYASGSVSGSNNNFGGAMVSAQGTKDAFLLQLNASDGSYSSHITLGNTGQTDESGPLSIDGSGNIYLAGSFTGTLDVDPGSGVHTLTSVGTDDVFLLKLDGSLNFQDVGQIQANKTGATAGFMIGKAGGGDVTVDQYGGVHTAGSFQGSFDFDSGSGTSTLTSKGGTDVFVAYFLPQGQSIQTPQPAPASLGFTLGSTGTQYAAQVVTDASGNIYVAGVFTGTVDFDPSSMVYSLTATDSTGNGDIFLAKYDASGNFVWVQQIQVTETFNDFASSPGLYLQLDSSGNPYLAGEYEKHAQFSNGTTLVNSDPSGFIESTSQEAQQRDVFVSKFDPATGNLQWAGTFGHAGGNDFIDSFAVSSTQVFLVGAFSGASNYGVGTNGSISGSSTGITAQNGGGNGDGYLLAISASTGAYAWTKDFGGSLSGANVSMETVAVNSNGNPLVGGSYSGTIDFDHGGLGDSRASQNTALFIGEYSNSTGNEAWLKDAGDGGFNSTVSFNTIRSIAVLGDGTIFAVGDFNGSIKAQLTAGANNGTTVNLVSSSSSNHSAFLVAMDSTGDLESAVSWGGATGTSADKIQALTDPNTGLTSVYVGGSFNGTVNFGVNGGYAPFSTPADTFSVTSSTSSGVTTYTFTDNLHDSIYLAQYIFDESADAFSFGNVFQAPMVSATITTIEKVDINHNILSSTSTTKLSGSGLDPYTVHGNQIDFRIDSGGNIFLAGALFGSADFDLSSTATKTLSSAGGDDIFVVKYSTATYVDAAHPRTFTDADGDQVTISMTGAGSAVYTLTGGATSGADLQSLVLSGTQFSSTALSITVKKVSGAGTTTIGDVYTSDSQAGLKSITFGKGTILDGYLEVGGNLGALTLDAVNAGNTLDDTAIDTVNTNQGQTLMDPNAQILIGFDYDYVTNHDATLLVKPTVILGDVTGSVVMDVHGGLGNLTAHSWGDGGLVEATQSVGNFIISTGDMAVSLLLDPYHIGSTTTASTGTISDTGGNITGDISVEGGITGISAGGVDPSSDISASSVGSISVSSSNTTLGTSGTFGGTLTLTGTSTTTTLSALTTGDDFTGNLVSSTPVGNITIKGNFTGSITAPSIGAITAASFDNETGTAQTITSTSGNIGLIKATGVIPATDSVPHTLINHYIITSAGYFAGFSVARTGIKVDTTGIDHVGVTALAMGPTTVTLSGATSPLTAVNLSGIEHTSFTTTGTGTLSTNNGAIGNVAVTLTGTAIDTAGDAYGLKNVVLSALGKMGTISVTMNTMNSDTATAMNAVSVAGISIGAITAKVTAGAFLTSEIGITGSNFTTHGTALLAGSLGLVKVTLAGGAAETTGSGIQYSTFDTHNGSSLVDSVLGLNVAMTAQNGTAEGMNNVTVKGDTIATTLVSIAGGANLNNATGIDNNSSYTSATSTGAVTVTVSSADSSFTQYTGLEDSTFVAGTTIGNVAVTAKDTASAPSSGTTTGIFANNSDVVFTAGTNLGTVTVTAAGGESNNNPVTGAGGHRLKLTATSGLVGAMKFTSTRAANGTGVASGVGGMDVTAGTSIAGLTITGTITTAGASSVNLYAGQNIGSVVVSSTVAGANPVFDSSTILAGQGTNVIDSTTLTKASLATLTFGGDVTNSMIAAGGNLGAVSVTGNLANSLILAGATLGGDTSINGNETYIRNVAIASLMVKGTLQSSTIAVGIDPGGDFKWGTSDDVLGASVSALASTVSKIGAITLGAATSSSLSNPFQTAVPNAHDYAIEAAAITSIKIGSVANALALPVYIDANGNTTEDQSEILVRLL